MARSENARQRREVLTELREIKQRLGLLVDRWNVPGTVYLDPGEREGVATVKGYLRERRADEYPENSATEWQQLYASTDDLINRLSALREAAAQRYRVAAGTTAPEDRS